MHAPRETFTKRRYENSGADKNSQRLSALAHGEMRKLSGRKVVKP